MTRQLELSRDEAECLVDLLRQTEEEGRLDDRLRCLEEEIRELFGMVSREREAQAQREEYERAEREREAFRQTLRRGNAYQAARRRGMNHEQASAYAQAYVEGQAA